MCSFKYVPCIILILIINECVAVIYHLNDTEYERMPPLFALDAYEPCLRDPEGLYCMMELDLHEGVDNKLMSMIKAYSEYTVKHYNHSYIQRGVCVQKTCQKFIRNRRISDEEVLNEVLVECLNDTIWNEYGLEARMKSLNYCDKNGDASQTDISDWIVAAVFAAILFANLIGSCYNIIIKRKNRSKVTGNQYLLSFSLLQNWHFLTVTKPSDPRVDRLKGLHGYRTIIIFLMFSAHVIWIDSMGFTENTHDFEKSYEKISYQLIFNGMMIIQIFMVQSSFLLAYNLLLRSEKRPLSWQMYPKVLFMRWWRLTPPYAVVLAFTATWLRHAGAGPLWRLWAAGSVAAHCRAHWWRHLLYVNNYAPTDKFCAIQTWYLGAEMQIFAISVFLFLVTTSRGRRQALAALLLLGLVLPAAHVWLQDLDGIVIMNPEFYRKKESATFDVHVMGHNYLSLYAVGMATACVLYHLQKKGIDKKRNKILQVLSWCFFPAMMCLFMMGQGFYAEGPRASLAVRMAWAAGHRLLMGGLTAFAIASLVLRFNESNCALFECRAWVVPSRLSYCAYLVHINFIHILIANRAYLTQVSFYNMIIVYLGVALMSFAAALPLHLLVEAPAARLMKHFTGR